MSDGQKTEELRRSAHTVAGTLYGGGIGGECRHGGYNTCFLRQGRKPLPLYKVGEMCERCAATWHAAMAATLLDSLLIVDRLVEPPAAPAPTPGNSAGLSTCPTPTPTTWPSGRWLSNKTLSDRQFVKTKLDKPRPPKPFSTARKLHILDAYAALKDKAAKTAFLQSYGLKAWQMSDWRTRDKGVHAARARAARATRK
jgi:hypothetical protein